jgi:hypothetical protein
MAKKKNIVIVKANGERQVFSERKLRSSLRRARVRKNTIDSIVNTIKREIREGATTQDITKRAFELLRKDRHSEAARYNLRNAIMALGPNGFPFETLVGEIFRAQGFAVDVGVVDRGWCTEHEIDVSARKGAQHVLAECKFHNERGVKSDLKVALYVHARFMDLERWHEHTRPDKSRFHEGWLVTNTKLTWHAIEYAECAGLKMLAWNYPKKGSLRDILLESGVHPITCLETLSKKDVRNLLNKRVVSFQQFEEERDVVRSAGISAERIARTMKEIERLRIECKG